MKKLLIAVLLLSGLSGCVVAPAPGYYGGYYAAPGYYSHAYYGGYYRAYGGDRYYPGYYR